jgi:hypothetical protein
VNLKKITSVSLIALSALALTGCSLSREVTSLEPYAPSDGVQLDIQDLKVRNLILIQGTSGKAVLIGSFVNSSKNDVLATLTTKDSSGEELRVEFPVTAESKFDMGYNGTEPLAFQLDLVPGQMHSVYVNAGQDPMEILVPVVDGSLEEYREYAESLG